jgi:hypothetical protein
MLIFHPPGSIGTENDDPPTGAATLPFRLVLTGQAVTARQPSQQIGGDQYEENPFPEGNIHRDS